MMESTPVAAFKVSQPQLLFRLLIIPFNDPAVLGHFYQSFERGIRRHRRRSVLCRFRLASRPFDPSMARTGLGAAPRRSPGLLYMPRSVSLVGLAQKGVIP